MDGVDGDPGARAAEALDVTTRVVVDAPKLADASGAQAARDRAVALLRASDPKVTDALDDADRARRAQAWLDANDPSHAIADAAVVARIGAPVPPTGPLPCKAAITRAQATAKLRGLTADAWTDAIARCAGEDALVTALFSGARASASARRTAEAIERYEKIEALFPHHRVADDARFHAALLHKDLGDDARFESMLLALPDEYPEGDMRGEALFRVALAHMTRGDWQGAKGTLERIVLLEPNDLRWATAGRAAYFRARASSSTGEEEDARQRYAQIIASAPLSFYMAQAYARLDAVDHVRARDALALAIAREAPGAILTRDHAELGAPSFGRARALLEVGEVEEARRELTAAHLTETGVDPEVLWTIAESYNAAGAPEIGHAFARGKLTDFLAHYPAGRWRACWEIAFPRAFEALVARSSADNAIPSPLTWAIMREESSFVADAKSPADAYGLMQLIVPTARGVARGTGLGHDETALKRPEVSIALGAKLLAGLRASYPANRALAILAYNGGGTAVGRWLTARPDDEFDLWVEQVPYEETRGYVKRVLASEAAYAFLYAPQAMDDVLAIPSRVTRARALATGGATANGSGASAVSGASR
jgi:soluble lytic murein transglycosylase